jgi:superfamily I DNA/RNA helicase
MTFVFSEEQQKIIDEVPLSKTVHVVSATAGAGKTKTAEGIIAKYGHIKPFLYLSFNKSMVEEARPRLEKFNATVSTSHSVALAFTREQIPNFRVLSTDIFSVIPAALYKSGFVPWCGSEYNSVVEMLRNEPLENISFEDAKALDAIFAKMQKGELGMTHDAYLKYFTLHPLAPRWLAQKYSCIFLDEGQDTNKALAHFLGKTLHAGCSMTTYIVGDEHQGIYGFRKSVNAMAMMHRYQDDIQLKRHRLQTTYRFSREFSTQVSNLLVFLKGPMRMKVSGRLLGQESLETKTWPLGFGREQLDHCSFLFRFLDHVMDKEVCDYLNVKDFVPPPPLRPDSPPQTPPQTNSVFMMDTEDEHDSLSLVQEVVQKISRGHDLNVFRSPVSALPALSFGQMLSPLKDVSMKDDLSMKEVSMSETLTQPPDEVPFVKQREHVEKTFPKCDEETVGNWIVEISKKVHQPSVIGRNNLSLIPLMYKCAQQNLRIGLVGGVVKTQDFFSSIETDLKHFQGASESVLKKEMKRAEQSDDFSKVLSLKLISKFSVAGLSKMIQLIRGKLVTRQHEGDEDICPPQVTFGTAHMHKGLEFDNIIMLDNFEKPEAIMRLLHPEQRFFSFCDVWKNAHVPFCLQHPKSDLESQMIEEANLIYVALTRARKNMFVFSPEIYMLLHSGPLRAIKEMEKANQSSFFQNLSPPVKQNIFQQQNIFEAFASSRTRRTIKRI